MFRFPGIMMATIKAVLIWLLIFYSFCHGQIHHDKHEGLAVRNAKTREIIKYMNHSVDPCKDFYDFACGNWARYHTPNREAEITTTQTEVEARIRKDLQDMLEEGTRQESDGRRKVKNFFASCRNVDISTPKQRQFLLRFVQKHQGLPSVPDSNWNLNSYEWVNVIAMLRANYGLDILIGLEIDDNLETGLGKSIYLNEPKSTLIPVELCSAEATRQVSLRAQVYEVLQKKISTNMQQWFNLRSGDANRFAGDVVRFEFELCKQMRKDHSMPSVYEQELNSMNFPQYQQQHQGGRIGQNRLHGNIHDIKYRRKNPHEWKMFFNHTIDFQQFVDIAFNSTIHSQVYVRSESYFTHLSDVIRLHTKPTLANYIMYRALSAFSFPNDGRPQKRVKYCIEKVLQYFPSIMSEMYRERFQRHEAIVDVENLYGSIRKAFNFDINWMDQNTKRMALQKLTQFKVHFPMENYNVESLSFDQNAHDYWNKLEMIMSYNAKKELSRLFNNDPNSMTESIYSYDVGIQLQRTPQESRITIGLGLLQPPFYNFYYPEGMKMSLFGQRLARELASAFDIEGWRSNLQSLQSLDKRSEHEFRMRMECHRKQYSNYLHNNPYTFRNASRLREVTLDSIGLNIAFKAYLLWLEEQDPRGGALRGETLSNVDYTNTQLFFINFAQTRCAVKRHEQPTPDFLPMDRNTPERYNVNGILWNNPEFGREFNCAMGTIMNPDDKCLIY